MTFFLGATPVKYNGVCFRSKLEARWAYFFDRLGIPWEYEPKRYWLAAESYLVDFHVGGEYSKERGCLVGAVSVEIKGPDPTTAERDKYRRFSAMYPDGPSVILLLHGSPVKTRVYFYDNGKEIAENRVVGMYQCRTCRRWKVCGERIGCGHCKAANRKTVLFSVRDVATSAAHYAEFEDVSPEELHKLRSTAGADEEEKVNQHCRTCNSSAHVRRKVWRWLSGETAAECQCRKCGRTWDDDVLQGEPITRYGSTRSAA